MRKQRDLPTGWHYNTLGDVCDIRLGKTPSRKRDAYWQGGMYPWVTIGDMKGPVLQATSEKINDLAIRECKMQIVPRGTVVLSFKLSLGKVGVAATDLYTNEAIAAIIPKSDSVIQNGYLYYLLKSINLAAEARQAVKGWTVNKKILQSIGVVVPPLPVQERIVAILAKADEVRSKREAALTLCDSILAASFIAMFGDPYTNNADRFRHMALGSLADVRGGVTKGRRFRGQATVNVPYLRVANVQDGFLDLDEVKTIEVLPSDRERYRLCDGDILMTEGGDPDKLGRGCIWREEVKECIHQNHIFRVRTNRGQLLPEYLAALLRSQYAKSYFLSRAKRSSNLASVNSTQVKAFPVPVPPLALQQKFVIAVEQWERTADRLSTAYKRSDGTFRSLMHHAFSGALTADFEKTNEAWIKDQMALEEQIPRLVALALLAKRTSRNTQECLVTALMKLLFLVLMKGSASRRLYQFIPYHYGPFAKDVYRDLERLQTDGLVKIDNGDEDKTRITLTGLSAATKLTAQLPEEVLQDVQTVLDEYGDLGHQELLDRVYEEFPAYAKKSRLREKTAQKTQRAQQ